MSHAFHIAIDGPVAAGKGTVSKLLAERLGFLYIDTGAMYRMTAWLALSKGANLQDEAAVAALIEQAQMDMHNPTPDEKDGRLTTVILDDEDVSWKIRTEEVGNGASVVAQYPTVRKLLVAKQQQIAQGKDVVMEGRDITYRVLPDADLKIFLTASDIVRAKRRLAQLQARGEDVSFDEVYQDLVERDLRDSTRSVDPLQIVPGAWVVDTSELSIDDVVDVISGRVSSMRHSASME